MRELYLVRHGESEHHVRRLSGGWTDLSLTAFGHVQAEAAARRVAALVGEHPVMLYTSDLKRASESAAPVATALGVDAHAEPALREFDNGIARDRTIEEMLRIQLPRTGPAWDWVPFAEGESWRRFHTRVSGFLDSLGSPEAVVVAVTHGGTLECAVNWFLGIDDSVLDPTPSYGGAPSSITWLRRTDDDEPRIEFLNDTSHLAGLDA